MTIAKLIDALIAREGGYSNKEEAITSAIETALRARSQAAIHREPIPANARPYPCGHEGCGRTAYASGYCNVHYIRSRAGKDMDAPILNRRSGTICVTCDAPLKGKGGWRLCSRHYKRERLALIKRTVVAMMGGVCADCGESYPLAAFDFHHTGVKDAAVSQLMQNSPPAEIAREVIKCVLLCANCHRIRHSDE